MLSFGKAADGVTSHTLDSCFDKTPDRTELAKPRTPDRHRVAHMTAESLLRKPPEPTIDCHQKNYLARTASTGDTGEAHQPEPQMPATANKQRQHFESTSISLRHSSAFLGQSGLDLQRPLRDKSHMFEDSSMNILQIDELSSAAGLQQILPIHPKISTRDS